MVFDLDPGEGVSWPDLVGAAREIRERLGYRARKLRQAFGRQGLSRGPADRDADWETAKLSSSLRDAMAADSPTATSPR